MRVAMKALALILSLMATTSAFADCSDEVLADCGDFKIMNTMCPAFDSRGRLAGGTETVWALFIDPTVGKKDFTSNVYNDVMIYKTDLGEGKTVVVNFSSQILADLKRNAIYSTYSVQNELRGPERNCVDY